MSTGAELRDLWDFDDAPGSEARTSSDAEVAVRIELVRGRLLRSDFEQHRPRTCL